MSCPSCGAPLRVANGGANLRCDYCGNLVVAAADETGTQFIEEAEGQSCPACSMALWNAVVAGVALESCKRCHGHLVTIGVLEALIDRMRALHEESAIPSAADGNDLERKVPCPRCHRSMDTHFYYGGGHAVISTCEPCELHWLGGGVLMQIARAPHEREP